MKLPVKLDDLPVALANAVAAAQAAGLWGDAIDAFEDWLDEAEKRPASVLIMLAFMLYHDALEVMVDEVEELGTRALALLDEAEQPKQTAALRREIERAVRRDRAHSKAKTARVAKSREQRLESLDRAELRELAYKLGESNKPEDHVIAGRAWTLAAAYEERAYARNDCLGRAALAFADGGDWDEALPRLEQVLSSPKNYESWMSDYAWYRLLDKAVADKDVETFQTRWAAALAMDRANHFPFALPAQAEYLAFAVEHQLADIAKHIADVVMEHCSPRERNPLAALLDRARSLG